jgi:hypothetical protein
MAASDHLHPQQLAMFMTARELHGMNSIDVQRFPNDRMGGAWKSKDAMWKVKRRENKREGLDKDVAAHGVQEPVLIVHSENDGTRLANGHHRTTAAYDHNPDSYVPVKHGRLNY